MRSPFEISWMIHDRADGWKLDRMDFGHLAWTPHLVDSVDLQTEAGRQVLRDHQGYLHEPPKITRAGNLGAALAHIRLWVRLVQQQGGRGALLFEDNVLFHPDSLHRVNATLARVPDADFVNFAVLRPTGTVVDAAMGLHRYVVNPRMREPIANVWQSSYYLSRAGAQLLLRHLAARRLDFNHRIIDREVSRFWSSNASLAAYFVHPSVFGHRETTKDLRKRRNAWRPTSDFSSA